MLKWLYLTLLFVPHIICGQTYILEYSRITFFSEAPLENIDATTYKTRSIFKADEEEIAFQVPIRTFKFKKALMEEHFNENYLESEKYPNATFSGKINSFEKGKERKFPATAKGKINIHGVTKEITINGTVEQLDDKVIMRAKFPIHLNDFDIQIPKVVFYNIAEVVEVDVEFHYKEKD